MALASSGNDDSLVDALARHGIAVPPEHAGLGLQDTVEARTALDQLVRSARLHRTSLRQLVRGTCVRGYQHDFEPMLVMMQSGLLDPNLRDRDGRTWLHAIAAEADDGLDFTCGFLTVAERVAALVKQGADVNAVCGTYRFTPLDYAESRQEPAVINALLAAGAHRRDGTRPSGDA